MKKPLLQFDLTNEVYETDEVVTVKDAEIEVTVTVKELKKLLEQYLKGIKEATYE